MTQTLIVSKPKTSFLGLIMISPNSIKMENKLISPPATSLNAFKILHFRTSLAESALSVISTTGNSYCTVQKTPNRHPTAPRKYTLSAGRSCKTFPSIMSKIFLRSLKSRRNFISNTDINFRKFQTRVRLALKSRKIFLV